MKCFGMTKQFVFFFILLVISLVAVATVTQIAVWESTHTWDVSVMIGSLFDIVQVSISTLCEQDQAMQFWIDEATLELQMIQGEIIFWN